MSYVPPPPPPPPPLDWRSSSFDWRREKRETMHDPMGDGGAIAGFLYALAVLFGTAIGFVLIVLLMRGCG